MARITVVDRSKSGLYLQDLERKQREAAVYPPGQDRYIDPIDKSALKSKLEDLASGSVTDTEVDNFISGTVGDGTGSSGSGDDISLSNIASVATSDISAMTAGEISSSSDRQDVQDILSYHLVETSKFKLSFSDGILAEMRKDSWVKVFPDDASGRYSL